MFAWIYLKTVKSDSLKFLYALVQINQNNMCSENNVLHKIRKGTAFITADLLVQSEYYSFHVTSYNEWLLLLVEAKLVVKSAQLSSKKSGFTVLKSRKNNIMQITVKNS